MNNNTSTASVNYELDDLLYLMQRLRDRVSGCPWDIKQDFKSISACTIEEAYEVVEAIDNGDKVQIKEELGDLLFQVVFYSQMASEEGSFDFSQVVNVLCNKLIRRHPHVFPGGDLRAYRPSDELIDDAEIKRNWESIKEIERREKGEEGLLAGIATNLPALTCAEKLQKRAATVGFDWPNSLAIVEKIKEELGELEEALYNKENSTAVEEELGDLIFTCVNLARFQGMDTEKLMRKANKKFSRRIEYMELALEKAGLSLEDESVESLEAYWSKSKRAGL